MTMRKKLLITIACLSVVLCTLVTGTLAWLIAESQSITNTFTPSNVKVELTEVNKGLDNVFQMIPGKTYAKDPMVTVETDIPCYVFVKVEEKIGKFTYKDSNGTDKTAAFADYLTYSVKTGETEWEQLKDAQGNAISGVYYRKVSANGSFCVLTGGNVNENGEVAVKEEVTMEMMAALNTVDNYPKLIFTAYAIQQEGFTTPAAAWAKIGK